MVDNLDHGFPVHLISKLCCIHDGAELAIADNCQLCQDGKLIKYGILVCLVCKTCFSIDDGILNMLHTVALDDESKHEQKLRNEHAKSISVTKPAWLENEHNAMEMIPTLEEVCLGRNQTLLELGCGGGRYTVLLAGNCQWIVAIDFSLESLRILQQRLIDTRNVGLVLGDITNVKVSAASYDRVLSTLVSNLPTLEHRNSMYQLAANALKQNGRFIFSTHNHGIRQKLGAVAKSGRYMQGGIYRYNFTVSECKAEARPYFKVIKARPIQIYFPFIRRLRLRLPIVTLSRVLESIPLINDLGELILCTAERPIRISPDLGSA